MALEDDLKRASELGRALKNALGVEELPATSETTQEMEVGSPRTPGYEPDYGQTMKDALQRPIDTSSGKITEFDKALEAAQQQGQENSESHEQGKSLDR